ncbi:MAG: hypothetical protein HY296_06600 [Thaumarchaeota archaeon]|nr:hypothetical protein [Nitrososphaerota archaeon]
MDTEFLGLSFVFILIGVAGIALFYGPMNAAGDSCYCLIPSPEPGAAQGTSSIFLALGLMFFPMGLMKGGLPSFRRPTVAVPVSTGAQTKVVAPAVVSSGGLVALGVALVVIGIDFILVPGFLVLKDLLYEAGGAGVTGIGIAFLLWGIRRPKSA